MRGGVISPRLPGQYTSVIDTVQKGKDLQTLGQKNSQVHPVTILPAKKDN